MVDNNLESIKQLQKPPQNSTDTNGSYIMSFKSSEKSSDKSSEKLFVGTGSLTRIYDKYNRMLSDSDSDSITEKITGWNIVNLVLPNETLLIALMNLY